MEEKAMKEMFSGMIGDYLLLQSQVEAQGILLLTLLAATDPGGNPIETARKYDKTYKQHVYNIHQKKLASHEYLDSYWKQKLQMELGDIPGILIGDDPKKK